MLLIVAVLGPVAGARGQAEPPALPKPVPPKSAPVAKPAGVPVAKPAGVPAAKPGGVPVAKPGGAPAAKPVPVVKPAPITKPVPGVPPRPAGPPLRPPGAAAAPGLRPVPGAAAPVRAVPPATPTPTPTPTPITPPPVALPPGKPPPPAANFIVHPFVQDIRETSLVVSFTTDRPAAGVVRIDETHATFLSALGTSHRVQISGLKPGTRYRYTVAIRSIGPAGPGGLLGEPGPEVSDPPAEFNTVPAEPGRPFVFLVYGDNRDREADHAAVIQRMLPEHADFVIQTGDVVGRANDEYQWRKFFRAAGPLLRSVPMYPALGNHELRGDPDAAFFFRYFALPGGGTNRRRPVYYSFRYGNSVFVALDGNSPHDAEQASWLEKTLATTSLDRTVRHVFAFVHQPPYSVGAYCGSERLQRRLVPILQRYQVRAVFAGHEHAYQHLERAGLRYFVSGGGGAPLYTRSQSCNAEDDMALRLFRAEHHYLRVQIDGDAATLVAISKSGELMERVLLHEPVPLDRPEIPEEPQILAAEAPSAAADPAPRRHPPGPNVTAPPKPSLAGTLLLLLLWASGLLVVGGLLMLTTPQLLGGRRRRQDLQPSARRTTGGPAPGGGSGPVSLSGSGRRRGR